MLSDITAATVTGNAVAFNGPGRLKGISFVNAATGGNIVFRDGGASGTVKLTLATPAVAGGDDIILPEDGIRFTSDIHVTVGDATSVTVFVG